MENFSEKIRKIAVFVLAFIIVGCTHFVPEERNPCDGGYSYQAEVKNLIGGQLEKEIKENITDSAQKDEGLKYVGDIKNYSAKNANLINDSSKHSQYMQTIACAKHMIINDISDKKIKDEKIVELLADLRKWRDSLLPSASSKNADANNKSGSKNNDKENYEALVISFKKTKYDTSILNQIDTSLAFDRYDEMQKFLEKVIDSLAKTKK